MYISTGLPAIIITNQTLTYFILSALIVHFYIELFRKTRWGLGGLIER